MQMVLFLKALETARCFYTWGRFFDTPSPVGLGVTTRLPALADPIHGAVASPSRVTIVAKM